MNIRSPAALRALASGAIGMAAAVAVVAAAAQSPSLAQTTGVHTPAAGSGERKGNHRRHADALGQS